MAIILGLGETKNDLVIHKLLLDQKRGDVMWIIEGNTNHSHFFTDFVEGTERTWKRWPDFFKLESITLLSIRTQIHLWSRGEYWWIFAEARIGEVNIYHSSPTQRLIIVLVYTNPVDTCSWYQIVPFFLRNEGKLARKIQKIAGRWIADTIPSLSSQSERAKNTIHWFGTY